MEEFIRIIRDFAYGAIFVFAAAVASAVALSFLTRFIWWCRYPFLAANDLQWYLSAPLQHFMRDRNSPWPRIYYFLFAPFRLAYGLAAYVALAPLRLLNAIYFDMILSWSCSLRDAAHDLLFPRRGIYRRSTKLGYALLWPTLLPARTAVFLIVSAYSIFQGVAAAIFDLFWPTLTLFHGTDFDEKASKIAQSGIWYVGYGDFAGTGIYFGLRQEVAENYMRTHPRPSIIIARVTPALTRRISTLPKELRRLVGRDGDRISRGVRWPFAALEHWREDCEWHELCLIRKKKGEYVNTWRVRPVCVVADGAPRRIWGGLKPWPSDAAGWVLMIGTLLVLGALILGLN